MRVDRHAIGGPIACGVLRQRRLATATTNSRSDRHGESDEPVDDAKRLQLEDVNHEADAHARNESPQALDLRVEH